MTTFEALHVLLLFGGLGGFCLAVLSSLLYLVVQHQLKRKRFGALLDRLPSLERLDRAALRSIWAGFIALTTGLVAGVFLAHRQWSSDWPNDPAVRSSALTWGWYLILLVVRYVRGWRGTRFFVLILIGFLFLVFTLAGVWYVFPQGAHKWI